MTDWTARLNERFTELSAIVKPVANSVGRDFPSIHPDYIESELWTWCYERPRKTLEMLDETENPGKALRLRLHRVGRSYAVAEKAAAAGYSVGDNYHYSLGELRLLLEDVWEWENWTAGGQVIDTQPKSKALANTTGDRTAALADVSAAVDKLTDVHYNCLQYVHKERMDYAMLAEYYEINEEAAKKRHQRALKALQKELGGPDPFQEYEGVRRARSNAACIAETRGQYDE